MQKKSFDTFQNPVGIERTFFNIIKIIYDKPMVKIILNGEKLKAFSPRTETKIRMSTC